MPERFSRANKHGIAPDLAKDVKLLVQSAWDGSMLLQSRLVEPSSIGCGGIPLDGAIKKSTAELDAAAMSYLANELFSRDVATAFTNLKTKKFGVMSAFDYNNI